MFVWNEDDLNKEQSDAIKDDANILLIACPGSGKTRTLIYKIALELSKLTSTKKFIIAITYTHRAADEIKERIELLGVDTSQLWIGTIHSFCLEWIIRPYHIYEEDLKFGYRIINSHETEELLTELCVPYSSNRVTHFDCGYYFTSKGYIQLCQNWKKEDVSMILSNYWQVLAQRKHIDFEMILGYAFSLLDNQDFVSKNLSMIFSYILIDEYQDTKEIQYHIFAKIIKAGKETIKSFIVGDPNQAIYTSLGGYAIAKSELEILTSQTYKELTLSGNYRSSKMVIRYFDHYKTYPNAIFGCGKNKDYDSVISYNTTLKREELEDEIVRLIKYNVEEKLISPNEICIVAPWWVHLASLTRSLMVKLPDYSFNGPGMAPFARDIDNFFYKLCRIVLTEPSPHMYVNRLRWTSDIISELRHYGLNVNSLTPKSLLKKSNAIIINESDGIIYLKRAFTILMNELGIDVYKFPALEEQYNSFFKSSEDRISRLVKDGSDFISTTENFRKVFKQRDGITISTIHGVKGAEFNTVIAFALLQDYVPHSSDIDLYAAQKLLYVISSRAIKNLHLLSERGRFRNWGNPPAEYVATNILRLYDYDYSKC